MSDHNHGHATGAHAEHDHHEHHDTFWTKYVFSQDHKMISKQFLITAIIMGFVAMVMSMIFRLQLGWPDEKFPFIEKLIGHWGKDGRLDPNF